jgi:hypothetical protein
VNASQFVAQLSKVSLPNVFNPYADHCQAHDRPESPAIRSANLKRYLESAIAEGIESVWLGRDCGYRGARRTGVALTDEIQLHTLESYFGIRGMEKATNGNALKERTATEVWKIVSKINVRIFLWNVFPFHPHEAGAPMSNRCHSQLEFEHCSELLVSLLNLLRPQSIVTLGLDAHAAVHRIGFNALPVRHPSYGGQREFADGVSRIYRIRGSENPK